MFNSRQYEWADITVIAGGRDLKGIRGIDYKESIEREPVYGKGRKPIAIQSGNWSCAGTITILQSDAEAIVDAAGGSLLSLSIDVEISYGNPPDSMRTDRLIGVRFTEDPRAMNQGDKHMEVALPFVCIDLEKNV